MLLSTTQLLVRSICGINLSRSIDLRTKIKCGYTRWASRTPSAIVNEDELFDITADDTETKINAEAFKTRKERSKTRKNKEKKKKEKNNEVEVVTEQGYTCFKADDRLVRYV